jgi:acetolactate synthase-1/2/3 large subunit
LCSAHQVLRLRPPQLLMTSGGLGEMGCGLPAAIGAAFARPGKRVICLSTDGGMMMNLQELQTIVHHWLPVKIIVFNNAGYGMLKQTQKNARMALSGVDADTGVSFPDYRRLATSFGITAAEVAGWDDFHRLLPAMLSVDGPTLIDYRMDPNQPLLPKLGYEIVNGQQRYARFDDMSPRQ